MMSSIRAAAGARAIAIGNAVTAGVGALLVVLLADGSNAGGLEQHSLPILAFVAALMALAPRRPWCEVLSGTSNTAVLAAATAVGLLLMSAGSWLRFWPGLDAGDTIMAWAGATLAGSVAVAVLRWARRHSPPVRLAVVGAADSAADLAREAAETRPGRYKVVGRIAESAEPFATADARMLGIVADLPEIISSHRLELLVLAPEASRLPVYDAITSTCLAAPVQVAGLDEFYEYVFGHVPISSINSCWFQHLLALDRGPDRRACKRVVDLVLALSLGVVAAPLLALLVVLIRRDGAPALFCQVRIGEKGRPFTILKLRTMRVQDQLEPSWTAEHDPRITRLGRILRRTHVDELPQLVNVFRGEMSIVGPRPEQVPLVKRLETLVPHYRPRHLVRPGIAGWAQLRCGYAGSDVGSAWKTCHDLYYLAHRSIRFDFAILIETVLNTLFGPLLPSASATLASESRHAALLGLPGCEPVPPSATLPVALEAARLVMSPTGSESTE